MQPVIWRIIIVVIVYLGELQVGTLKKEPWSINYDALDYLGEVRVEF
jgi:hypothetical protein